MDIRPYESQDEERKSDLDLHVTVSPGVRICRRYTHLDAHARMYGRCHTFVAEHEGRIVGVISAAIKDVRLAGQSTRAGYLFGLRVAPQARRHGVASALHARAEQATKDDGVAATYAIVMADNASVMPLTSKFALAQTDRVETLVAPVTRQRSDRTNVRTEHLPEAIAQRIDPFFEKHDLFVRGSERYPAAGQFVLHCAERGSSSAAVTVSSHSAAFQDLVEFVPACLRPLRCFWDTIRPLVTLPHIPVRGRTVSTRWIGEPVLEGPEALGLLHEVFRHIHNKAVEEGVHWLMMPIRSSDPRRQLIRDAFSAGRLARLLRADSTVPSLLLFKPFVRGCTVNPERLYLDTRDF
ncbi:MAG: GNAT family N-acetyltransferase [Sedimentisphaerales bacterium]|nr:GNAT family N-acetyltransferase [Sedimentisphaerales bacterium]HNY80307.1 GNAT family N-acetyltransferase [Sedimentisphaerales bacterium]HOC65102.1 GNAT family N-acetyltransferase [Sedimentisphaerales bacterium]HOH66067.1 GNAT family N-acetyltransferase [Sedimentisphaerales bacterium]HPY48207.1 GNAT family N-acetyltransferase [Sedimentisphaerales bacterium]